MIISEAVNGDEIQFRAYIRKHRRINIPVHYPDIKNGDLYNITLKKVNNNNSEEKSEETNQGSEN